MKNNKNLFDLEIKKETSQNTDELEPQTAGPAIRASVKQCQKTLKATSLFTVSCKGKNGCK